jgi:hypothetical protein
MKNVSVLITILAAMAATVPAAAQDGETPPPQDESSAPVSPDDEAAPPPWADPNVQPPDIGVNDDRTPFNPADVGGGSSPLEPDNF